MLFCPLTLLKSLAVAMAMPTFLASLWGKITASYLAKLFRQFHLSNRAYLVLFRTEDFVIDRSICLVFSLCIKNTSPLLQHCDGAIGAFRLAIEGFVG